MNTYRALAVILCVGITGCGFAHNQSAVPRTMSVTSTVPKRSAGNVVSVQRFRSLMALAKPSATFRETESIHVRDGNAVYAFPSTAIVDHAASGMTVRVGDRVFELSMRAKIVGHGRRHEYTRPSQSFPTVP